MAGKSILVPVWRLREVRNIAESMAYRAGCCPVARLVNVAEREYLKPTAHIRLFIDPKLNVSHAYYYLQVLKNVQSEDDPGSKSDLIEVTICFNGDITTKYKWGKTARAIVTELGRVIFFSRAAKRRVLAENEEDEKKLIEYFVNCVLRKHPFAFDNTNRPRLMLAHLQEIVKRDMHKKTKEVLPHIQKLLMPYLGPDGW
ncbi:MAG: hypothetical protein KAY65_02140 [Planctomycetes bacterium]|nr:hypothetical protein [Planctomycetota bacterium]